MSLFDVVSTIDNKTWQSPLVIGLLIRLLRDEIIGNKQRKGSVDMADKYMQEMAEFIDSIREVEAYLVVDIR